MNLIKELCRAIINDEIVSYKNEIKVKTETINEQSKRINKLIYPNPKEEYYNNKYPKFPRAYNKKFLNKILNLDVRCFVGNYNNLSIPKVNGTDDEKAIAALIWVVQNFKYVSDEKVFGLQEYWAFSFESLDRKQGDCDDGAILLYDILRANGIPAWRLRLACGLAINPWNGNVDGHCYLTYYSIKEDKWIALDWCYLPNMNKISEQDSYNNISHYGDVWFSFNEEYSWGNKKWE